MNRDSTCLARDRRWADGHSKGEFVNWSPTATVFAGLMLLGQHFGCGAGGPADPDGGPADGICGMSGQKVACTSDEDCEGSSTCTVLGQCEPMLLCASDADCLAPLVCSSGLCVQSCAADLACPQGWFCSQRICRAVHCTAEGGCPEGFGVIPGTMGCAPENGCVPGLMPGLCGMAAECVECVVDLDCPLGMYCGADGQCLDLPECEENEDCEDLEICNRDNRCVQPCINGCPENHICNHSERCEQARCSLDGECPSGWAPIEGSLLCQFVSCEVVGMREPGCGMSGQCVQCYSDLDCPNYNCNRYNGRCGYDSGYCSYDSECRFGDDDAVACRYGQCVDLCDNDGECRWGERCTGVGGECYEQFCPLDGECPDGFKPEEGSLRCMYDPCDELGRLSGACGLTGQCVDCLTDDDCPEGICNLSGVCRAPECTAEADCDDGLVCDQQRCRTTCISDFDCPPDWLCELDVHACRPVRCSKNKECSSWGFRPVMGSYACYFDPCYWTEHLIQGVCGLAESCVWCIDDSDCSDGMRCTLSGTCESHPPCTDDSCSEGQVCAGSECVPACTSNSDCWGGEGRCDLEGACYTERCDRNGHCPLGWRPSSPSYHRGTLSCIRLQ